MRVNASESSSQGFDAAGREFELILVGGGLQNCLIAKSVLSARPEARILLVESSERLAGNHTWCFHAQDLPSAVASCCDSFVECRWSDYDVHFPELTRTLPSAYAMMTSDRVREATQAAITTSRNAQLLLGTQVTAALPGEVSTGAGQRFVAPLVVDARGPSSLGATEQGSSAFQKFLGLELQLSEDSPFHRPTLMDARVEQKDGFRFVYVLPFEPRRVLVEDTYYSLSPELDEGLLELRVLEYARTRGLSVERVIRSERGVLPLPLRSTPRTASAQNQAGLLISGGYAGGWLHPTTGYSGVAASRLAEYLMNTPTGRVNAEGVERIYAGMRGQARFCVWLNRFMFDAFEQNNRYSPLERFYRLPKELVERFYALKLSPADRLRVVCGKPPQGFSVSRMLQNAAQRGSMKAGILA